MTAFKEKSLPTGSQPLEGFESPFLNEESFVQEVAVGWEANLRTLERESPFLNTFEYAKLDGAELEEEEQLNEKPCTGIIDADDRRPVNRAWDVPYRWICQISATRRKGGKQLKPGPIGTGILISPRFVLTAAHLLRNSEKDDRGHWVDSEANDIVVTPARNANASGGNKTPFGQYKARAWQLCPKYNPRSADSWKYDYAIIELKEPAGAKRAPVLQNKPLCFWGSRECGSATYLEVLDATQLAGKTGYTAGYPSDLGGGASLFEAAGQLSGVDLSGRREIMNYHADGCPGQSGSPIWINQNGKRYLVGIFTKVGTGYNAITGRASINQAIRINQDVFAQIAKWLESAMETPWLNVREAPEETETEDLLRAAEAEQNFTSSEEVVWEQENAQVAEAGEDYEPLATEWSTELAGEETEDFTGVDDEAGERQVIEEQPLEEQFDPTAVPKDVVDALDKKDWPLALKLAIQAGLRNENELTNLIFFAQHTDLPKERIDPKHPRFKYLESEWARVFREIVWKAIQVSAENKALAVSGKEAAEHQPYFWGKKGKQLKKLIGESAKKADINPGLLGTTMIVESHGMPHIFLLSGKVRSYDVGLDDFYEEREAIAARVPAFAKIKWDKRQKPEEHLNDAKTNRRIVKTILFDSGHDAALATAVYMKFYETLLRESAVKLKGDFDALPLTTQMALTRMAMAAGMGGVMPRLKDTLDGKDIFIRKPISVTIYQTQRNATVRIAQAIQLSAWVFDSPVPVTTAQPELETVEDFDQEVEGIYGFGSQPDLRQAEDFLDAAVVGDDKPASLWEDSAAEIDLTEQKEWNYTEREDENFLFEGVSEARYEDDIPKDNQTSSQRLREVVSLQKSLNQWRGLNNQKPIREDGVITTETRKAVLEFQKTSGLKKQDGIAGPSTRERLALLLEILTHISTSALGDIDRRRQLGIVGSAGFRSMEPTMQTEVLKQLLRYQHHGKLTNIELMIDLVTQTGFELLSTSSQKLMLLTLSTRPDDKSLTATLSKLAFSPGFRSLEGPTQALVLKRIKSYAGYQARIDNLENLITTTLHFDQLSKDSQKVMLAALANHPDDKQLVESFSKIADYIDSRGLNPFHELAQVMQTDALNHIVAYPRKRRNVDNLMKLVLESLSFRDLSVGIRAQILNRLPVRYETISLDQSKVANLINMVTALRFEKLPPKIQEIMLDFQANRPDNAQLASALRNLAEDPQFWQNLRIADRMIDQVNNSVP